MVALSEGRVELNDNVIVGTNASIVSNTTGLIKCEYHGCSVHNNLMQATYLNYVLNITNGISETIDFSGNTLKLSNNNGIFRVNDYRSGVTLNAFRNDITGSYTELISSASNMTSYTYNFNLVDNQIDLTDCSATNVFNISNTNANSRIKISDNNFYATGAKSFTAFYVVKCNSYIINNDTSGITFSRAVRVDNGVTEIKIIGNVVDGALVRMNSAATCDTVMIMNNFSTGSTMFQTNVLTATTAYIINNTCAYTPDTSTYLSATTLYEKGNINYTTP